MNKSAAFTFYKMHGLGNDFAVLDGVRNTLPDLSPTLIQQWADRHTGIGFDQLLILRPCSDLQADLLYQIFNADGGEVAQCGNGARCVSFFAYHTQLVHKPLITLQTMQGRLIHTEVLADQTVKVNMGAPIFSPLEIPFNQQYATLLSNGQYEITVNQQKVICSVLSMGNPHAVILVDNSFNDAMIVEIGKSLNAHPAFPQGVNVGFLRVINLYTAQLCVYERGAGETLACGSGACAAHVAGMTLRLLSSSAQMMLLGGELTIQWENNHHPVWMQGPAALVYKGEYQHVQ